MSNQHLLLATIFVPLLGAIFMGISAQAGPNIVRGVALLATLITLGLASILISRFPDDGLGTDSFAVTDYDWFHGAATSGGDDLPQIQFSVGLDGLSIWLYGLSSLLMVTAVLVSWNAVQDRCGLFYGMLLLLETGCLGVFAARDLLLFTAPNSDQKEQRNER